MSMSADAAGYDKSGYNKEGFDKAGYNKWVAMAVLCCMQGLGQ